jgi:hypothetical protein
MRALTLADAATVRWRQGGRAWVSAIVKATYAWNQGAVMRATSPRPLERGAAPLCDLAPFVAQPEVFVSGRLRARGERLRLRVFDEEALALDKSVAAALGEVVTALAPVVRWSWPALGPGVVELSRAVDGVAFQRAPADQRLGALCGDEWIRVDGLEQGPEPCLSRLPGDVAEVRAYLADSDPGGWGDMWLEVPTRLASVELALDAQRCSLVWRGQLRADGLRPDRVRMVAVVAQPGELEEHWRRDALSPEDATTLERPPKRPSSVMARLGGTADLSEIAHQILESAALPASFAAQPRRRESQPHIAATPFDRAVPFTSQAPISTQAPVTPEWLSDTADEVSPPATRDALPFRAPAAESSAPRHPTPAPLIKATPFDGSGATHSSPRPPPGGASIHAPIPPPPRAPRPESLRPSGAQPTAHARVAPPALLANLDDGDDDALRTPAAATDDAVTTPRQLGDTQDELGDERPAEPLPFSGGAPSRAPAMAAALPRATPFDPAPVAMGALGAFFLRAIGLPCASPPGTYSGR